MAEARIAEQLNVRLVPGNVKKFVSDVIEKYHPTLDVNRILVAFTSKEMKTKGKRVLACIAVASPVANLAYAAAFANQTDSKEGMCRMLDYYLLIDQEAWYQLDEQEQLALIDHELCHVYYKEDSDKPTLVTHDFEDFQQIVERHGPWTSALKRVCEKLATMPKDAVKDSPVKEGE